MPTVADMLGTQNVLVVQNVLAAAAAPDAGDMRHMSHLNIMSASVSSVPTVTATATGKTVLPTRDARPVRDVAPDKGVSAAI